MTDDFVVAPAPGDPLDLNPMLGSLLVFQVNELIEHVPTVHTIPGEKTPAVRADVYCLDWAQGGFERKDALVFPRVLQGQLRASVGKKVLGRLRKGVAKAGHAAPWELAPATQEDLRLAQEWSNRRSFTSASSGPSSEAPF